MSIATIDAAGSPEQVGEAVGYAADKAWLQTGGNPPHSLAITEERRKLTTRN